MHEFSWNLYPIGKIFTGEIIDQVCGLSVSRTSPKDFRTANCTLQAFDQGILNDQDTKRQDKCRAVFAAGGQGGLTPRKR